MIPGHIGIIMDGNGRWAQQRGLPRSAGYKEGLRALLRVLGRASELGVKAVSVYTFSKENFRRPTEEINAVSEVVQAFNEHYDGDMVIRYSGDIDGFSDELASSVDAVEKRTADNKGIILNILFAYGGRQDILRAAKLCHDHGEFTEDAFIGNLSTCGLPPLDLIIRSGGEKRLSNFMLYEAAYAELVFTDKLWPDVDGDDLAAFIKEYGGRTRKFGA